jgi:hypothetical protein
MQMLRYTFREPLPLKNAKDADPNVIGKALEEIAAKNDGELTPVNTVAAAKSPRHVLHRHFEWRDHLAAQQYRLDQARTLIRCVQLVDDKDKSQTARPAFLSITDKAGTSYHGIGEIMKSSTLQAAVLKQAERDLEAFERRYSELSDICVLIRDAKTRVRTRLDEMEAARPHI